ncbi:MAG: HD domain-containing protein, partial [Clostridia bacterium]
FFSINQCETTQSRGGETFALLANCKDMEIMKQSIPTDSAVWVTPSESAGVLEFFFVISGELVVDIKSGTVTLKQGDSFFVDSLKEEVSLKAKTKTELLYVTNSHVFDSLNYFQKELTDLLMQINEKDNITYLHSKNVVRFSMKLFEKLSSNQDKATMDKLVTSALFHDVGKCFVPDEILKKAGELTNEEFKYIIKHPIDTRHMLRTRFGPEIAEIAACHHERLDGSGYPYGLTGDEVSFESKILSVADAFEAMTSQRHYNKPKTFVAAAEELRSMCTKFDSEITRALVELAESGAFNQ